MIAYDVYESEAGMQFAMATARMPYGCDIKLAKLHMKTLGIVTNGVFLYDFENIFKDLDNVRAR